VGCRGFVVCFIVVAYHLTHSTYFSSVPFSQHEYFACSVGCFSETLHTTEFLSSNTSHFWIFFGVCHHRRSHQPPVDSVVFASQILFPLAPVAKSLLVHVTRPLQVAVSVLLFIVGREEDSRKASLHQVDDLKVNNATL
jgi:hypothetical protein